MLESLWDPESSHAAGASLGSYSQFAERLKIMHPNITVAELKNRLEHGEPIQLVDVRGADEYAVGHIPGAINMPLAEAESRVDDLARRSPVVLVCQSGRRAGMACELLQEHHDGLLVLEGGTQAWMSANNPVVSSLATRWALERQVRLGAGLMILLGVILGFLVHPGWFGLAGFVGAGLTFAGLTNVCGMAMVLAKCPWNQPAKSTAPTQEALR